MNKENIYASVRKSAIELKTRRSVIDEQRSILIATLAEHILSALGGETPETVYKEFLSALDTADIVDKLIFSKAISSHFSEDELLRLLLSVNSEENTRAGAHGKISYIRNRYNDEAYAKFSLVVPHAKPVYCSSFEEACETVSSDECEFTMLPLEDSTDGKMFGFYSLLDRYELKIAYVCSVEREDSSKTIRYALACKHFMLDKAEKAKRDKTRIFEFTITHTPSNKLFDVYRAAALSNAKEHRASSLSLPYGDNMARFYHSFIITKKTDFLPFLLLLSLEYPEYSPIGIYREI